MFRPASDGAGLHEYEGVRCQSGAPGALAAVAGQFRPDVVAAHGVSEGMWPWIAVLENVPVCGWLHGSEIPAFFRQKAQAIADRGQRNAVMQQVDVRGRFWRDTLRGTRPELKLVFPSQSAVSMMRETLPDLRDCAVIANPIDTDLFCYREKGDDDRFRVLSIRPFDSPTYANDLSVAAIRHLAERPGFGQLRFTIIGDGPLFEQTLDPVGGMSNVTIRKEFLTQSEIAEEHSRHGIFLVPTRLDTQGVSRDEAMSSGLVPVTNAIAPVLEFADDESAALAVPDDAAGLANKLWEMIESPDLFRRRSAAAAERVRRQSANDIVIPEELALLASAVNG